MVLLPEPRRPHCSLLADTPRLEHARKPPQGGCTRRSAVGAGLG